MHNKLLVLGICCLISFFLGIGPARASMVSVNMYETTAYGQGERVGPLVFSDSPHGLEIWADLSNLPPGEHHLYLHEHGICAPMAYEGVLVPGLAAGEPIHDLLTLTVNNTGQARVAIRINQLSVEAIMGRAVLIHEGSQPYRPGEDNFRPRLGCGIVR